MNSEDIMKLGPRIRVNDALPPRHAVLALVTLAGVDPDHLVAWQDSKNGSWTITALGRGGLTVVEVDDPTSGAWKWAQSEKPASGTVRAAWYPYSSVRSVELVDIEIFGDVFYQEGPTVEGYFGWRIHLEGREPVDLPYELKVAERTNELVEALRKALAG